MDGVGVGAIRQRVIDADRFAFFHGIVVDNAVVIARVFQGIDIAIEHREGAAFRVLVRDSQNGVNVG